MYYWYIGKGDYMTVYDAAPRRTSPVGQHTSWEGQICASSATHLREEPVGSNALNAVSKYQMKWFLWNAKRNGGCAIGILDGVTRGDQIKSAGRHARPPRLRGGDVAYISPGG